MKHNYDGRFIVQVFAPHPPVLDPAQHAPPLKSTQTPEQAAEKIRAARERQQAKAARRAQGKP